MAVWKSGSRSVGSGLLKQARLPKATPGFRSAPRQYVVGAAPSAPAPPAPYRMPDGTAPWATTAIAAAAQNKDPATDLSWQDSGYNTTLANLLSQKSQGQAALLAASRRAAEDRDKNVGLLGESRVNSKASATKSANKQGLFYSGALGKNLGDLDTDYDRRTTDVNTAFTRGEEDRAAQAQGLGTAYDQAQQSAAQQAIDRWINGATAAESASTPSLDAIIAALTATNAKANARSR